MAQLNLGMMYDRGRGVARDEIVAHAWLSLPTLLGNKEAQRSRDIVGRRLTPAQLAEARKLARNWMARLISGRRAQSRIRHFPCEIVARSVTPMPDLAHVAISSIRS